MVVVKKETLKFQGHNHFRQRLVLATLSGKSVRIQNIRTDDQEHTGLTDYEASFIRLIEKITNGSTIEISYTGTSLTYHPGVISGGSINHDCPKTRAIGYFLEPLVALAPFCKTPLSLTLNGITNDNIDVSVDSIRTVLLPQLQKFGVGDGIELKINKRGAVPNGGGQVTFTCPIVKQLKPVQFVDGGLIKRIRGIAYCTRMSPQMANRVVESARSILSRYIPDVYIYTDVYKGSESGSSPGYALSLVAESTTDALISTECAYQPRKRPKLQEFDQSKMFQDSVSPVVEEEGLSSMLANDYNFPTPEDLGVRTARQLLTEIKKGGTVDTISQWLNLLFITLGPEDVGKIRVGTLSPFTIQYLRDLKTFFGTTFKLNPDKETRTVVLTSVGIGFTNINKKVT
ncbi:rRNA-processing endoribonuclease [Boothiomyces sp. JEL0866]|nr:rRNA-processing endoribonuclease [Boothiomyces sp. JEL0866]